MTKTRPPLAEPPAWLMEELRKRAAGKNKPRAKALKLCGGAVGQGPEAEVEPLQALPDAAIKINPLTLAQGLQAAKPWVRKAMEGVVKGERNQTATKLAGFFLSKGIDFGEADTLEVLRLWNPRNSPPLTEKELLAVWNSIRATEARSRILSKSDKTLSLAEVSQVIGAKITKVEFYPGDTPFFMLMVAVGEQEVAVNLTMAELRSRTAFQNKMAQATFHIPRLPPRKNEEELYQIQEGIMRSAAIIKTGSESTSAGMVREWWLEYAHHSIHHRMVVFPSGEVDEDFEKNPYSPHVRLLLVLRRPKIGWFARLLCFVDDCKTNHRDFGKGKVVAQIWGVLGFTPDQFKVGGVNVRAYKVPKTLWTPQMKTLFGGTSEEEVVEKSQDSRK